LGAVLFVFLSMVFLIGSHACICSNVCSCCTH
jgi:hypothetical protein